MLNELTAFYGKHDISPVRQDVENLVAHFERRESLYRQLGILPAFFAGKKILEVGPGSGFNSLHLVNMVPSNFTLVEGNPSGVRDIKSLLNKHIEDGTIKLIPTFLEESNIDELFNFVLCEGVLAALGDAADVLFNRLFSFVAPGGVLIITCSDSVSVFPEMMRRLFALLLVEPDISLEKKTHFLIPIFKPHLCTLNGMSRRFDDWIIDNLINPCAIGNLFSITEAIELLPDDFEVYGTSPHFIADWRWYKSIVGKQRNLNERALEQYWQNAHNLLDYRFVFTARPASQNMELYNACSGIHALIRIFEAERDPFVVQEIKERLLVLEEMVAEFSPGTALALKEARTLLTWPKQPIDTNALVASKNFGCLFGRGQQYLSISRKV